jgi:hypothetical protein
MNFYSCSHGSDASKSYAYFIKPSNRILRQQYSNPRTVFYYTARSVSTERSFLQGSLSGIYTV